MRQSDLESSAQAVLEQFGADEIDSYSEEERRVLFWRIDQFVRLGFDYVDSILLANDRVDLNQSRKLIAAGCPVGTAARILL